MEKLDLKRKAEVYYEESIGSTNTALKKMAAGGAADGTVLISGRQTAGRGRLGRSFVSPPGGLYLSMLLRPEKMEGAARISAWAALAVGKAMKRCCGITADIKWPNDILYKGKKLCGILAESVCCGDNIYIVLGMGVNLNTPENAFPEELQSTAASVFSLTGKETDIKEFASVLIEEMDRICADWKSGISCAVEYREHCINLGSRVSLIRDGLRKEALALDVNEDLSLRVRYEDGSEENINFGEVSLRDC